MEGRRATGAVVSRRVWTFHLRGGSPFRGTVGIPNAFPAAIDHPGGKATTVCALRLSLKEAEQVEELLRSSGVQVQRWSVEETTEQRELRDRLRTAPDLVYPSVKCPGCFWLDLEGSSLCGYKGWPPVMVQEALATHPQAVTDADGCPVYCGDIDHKA